MDSVLVRGITRTAAKAALIALTMAVAACSQSAQEHKASGDRYLAQKQYNQAIVEYQNALKRNPKMADARTKLGDAYQLTGRTANAVGEYIRAADLLPDNIPLQLVAVRAFLTAGRFEDAKARTEQILTKDPKNAAAQSLLGSALIGLRDLTGAVKELEEAIRLDPTRASSQTAYGALKVSIGDREAAEAAFKRAVALDPKSVQPRLTLANFLWWTNRVDAAEAVFKEALTVAPADELANRSLALFYMATRRSPQAEPYLKAYAAAANRADASITLAEYYLSTKQQPQAVAILEALSAGKDPAGSVSARWRLASLYYQDGQKSQAHAMIDDILRKDPNETRALLVKADFFAQEGKLDDALARAKMAAAAEPQSVNAHYALGNIYRDRNDTDQAIVEFSEVVRLNPSAVEAETALAQLHLKENNLVKSEQYAQEALRTRPGDVPARMTLIANLISQGDGRKAETALKPLVNGAPDWATTHAYQGAAELLNKNPTAARQSFERALALDPKQNEALAGLVSMDISSNKIADAIRRVETRLAETPKDPAVLVLAAQVYAASGNRDKIEPLLQQVIQLEPANLRAYEMLGRHYVSINRLDAALVQFETMTTQRPKDISAQTMVALLLAAQGKNAEAQQRYERILEIDPHAAIAANNLAAIMAERGDNLDRALELAQTAKAGLANHPAIDDTLGWVYFKKNLIPAALPLLRSSAEKQPNDPTYQYHLGLAYAKSGDKVRARQSLETALRLAPNFPESADAKRVLANF